MMMFLLLKNHPSTVVIFLCLVTTLVVFPLQFSCSYAEAAAVLMEAQQDGDATTRTESTTSSSSSSEEEEKERYSSSSSDSHDKSNNMKIPIIDLKPWFDSQNDYDDDDDKNKLKMKDNVVQQVAMACRNVGFFMIINHGLDIQTENQTWTYSSKFFDMPLKEKLKLKSQNETEYPYGYEQSEQLSKGKQLDNNDGNDKNKDSSQQSQSTSNQTTATTTDLKETFAIGPNNIQSGMPLRRWIMNNNNHTNNNYTISHDDDDNIMIEFRHALEDYYEKMELLANTLLEIFALALELPQNYFVTKMDHHMSALRLVHYYPLILSESEQQQYSDDDDDDKSKSKNDIDESNLIVRAGAHTDYGALTILNAKSSGLQVQLPASTTTTTTTTTTTKKEWYTVPVISNALIINLGDLMQRWTNDQWISTLHRVVMPLTATTKTISPNQPQQQQQENRRYSIAYFVNINGDTIIENLDPTNGSTTTTSSSSSKSKYKPITAKEHLMAKHLASMNEKEAEEESTAAEENEVVESEGEIQQSPPSQQQQQQQQSDEL